MAHTLAPLPYDYAALEPYIDAQTMQLHHDKHHAAYVNNLNAALEKYPDLTSKSVEELIINLEQIPAEIRTVVRNNAGGHFNHTLFWKSMSPNGSRTPTGAIAEAIEVTFGSFDNFKQQFNEAGMKQFGSGWVWLTFNHSGKVEIVTTPNQDSPLTSGLYPLLGNDVWEHAYYLKYQNRRKDYLDAWWNVVDWHEVNRRLETARQ
ncbi:MAG: superoxide dismutase [Chlorogloeopsis fritschii C42_A2020_084]|uniref:superoxide dismutase n=1 Tax=Chlorogloeopsis fritschii TaxID=1124 RepID=UPI0019E14B48|nr:superoxide dismutase [Chlorogloeopsis fritschii]MBF2009563.1 superoxide dismutase [Chlorogloeopsis fritschii C42_A2020_084]